MYVVLWQCGPSGKLYAVPAPAGILPGFVLVGVSVLGEAEAEVVQEVCDAIMAEAEEALRAA